LQGKDDVFGHVARRNDKLRDVFRGEGILWTFSPPGDSMVTTRYGRNSMLQCLTGEKCHAKDALCHVVGCFVDKKRRVQDMLRYEGVC